MPSEASMATMVVLAAAAFTAAHAQVIGDPAGPVPGDAGPLPGWIGAVPVDDWCGTTQRYLAELAAFGVDPSRAMCPPAGPCDDPFMRDDFIPDGSTMMTVQLSIHVLCESGGGNCAATLADVDAAVAELNAHYEPWGFQFTYVTEFVKDSKYRNIADGNDGMMKHRYADSPETMLNIYVVNTGGVSWGTFPWSQYAQTFYGGIVIHESWFGGGPGALAVLTHEVGHCLGLWHTFHGVSEVPACSDCYERAGRSALEGDVTGDLCSDTAPTPPHSGQCTDPTDIDSCSSMAWGATNLLNFMGYTCRTTRDEFTPQQAGRMQCWTTDVLSGWLVSAPPPNVPGTPALMSQGGQILASWADNSGNEEGFEVERQKKSGKNKWGGSVIVAVGANVTSYTDAPGAGTFRYRVRAYNADGESAWSAWAEISN